MNKYINELMQTVRSEPSYFFEIGDKVEVGNLKNVVVADKTNDGMAYKIQFESSAKTGVKLERWAAWYEVRPPRAKNDHSLIRNQNLQLNFAGTTLGDLISTHYTAGINYEPEYQRGYVWTLDDKQKLISSIFSNIDIGKFVLRNLDISQVNDMNIMYEIVDGKQRLSAIIEYYENRFAEPEKGLYYNDLTKAEQRFFRDFHIQKAVLRNADMRQTLESFIFLNTYGKRMDESHIQAVQNMLSEIQAKS